MGYILQIHAAWGNLTTSEVATIVDRGLAVDPGHPDANELHDLTSAIKRAAHFDLGIVTTDA